MRDILAAAGGRVRWGISASVAGRTVLAVDRGRTLRTASVGKVLLLVAVAEDIRAGLLDPLEPLTATDDDLVADSGLWQHLATRVLPVADAATLVGAVSDNLATNVLLRRVGLDRVARVSADLGTPDTRMLDRIRDARGPADPSDPSRGTAGDLERLVGAIGSAPADSALGAVAGWLRRGADLSMVASAWGLDPLAHDGLLNKTGTDEGVRADVGWAECGCSYAVVANWDDPSESLTEDVLATMRAIGLELRALCRATSA